MAIGHNAVRLVVTASLPALPRYATLSYCWGREEFSKLNQGNMNLFFDHISPETLPQTFNDAIHAARQLGLEFIWIDALCIIQEQITNRDWEIEAGNMKSVYGGDFINLAASDATSVRQGFLERTKYLRGGFVARLTTREYCTVHMFHDLHFYEDATAETHLAGRAWTLQERLLPPRTIYFGANGVFWECRSQISSEFLLDATAPSLFTQLLLRPEKEPWKWNKSSGNTPGPT